MDDLLREFLTETNESLDTVDVELVRFEQDPNNAKILANIFRLVHTIKGTCGFLGLPRLEALAHAAETLMGKFRDGMPVTGAAVTLILSTIDRIKQMLDELERNQQEPAGDDRDLIGELEQMVLAAAKPAPAPRRRCAPPVAAEPVRKGTRDRRPARSPTRCWNGRCVRAKFRSTNWNAPSAKPRSRSCRSRPGRDGRSARPAAATGGGCRGRHERPAASGGPPRGRAARLQGRQSVDPRQRRDARASDDHGLRAGADPQPAPRDRPAPRGFRIQGAAAAALQRHRRAAGRRHEDPHAADRQRLAEAAAHRPRPRRPSSTSRSSSKCTAPTPSSTARCWS